MVMGMALLRLSTHTHTHTHTHTAVQLKVPSFPPSLQRCRLVGLSRKKGTKEGWSVLSLLFFPLLVLVSLGQDRLRERGKMSYLTGHRYNPMQRALRFPPKLLPPALSPPHTVF